MRDPDNLNIITGATEQLVVTIPSDLPRFDVEQYDILDDKDMNTYIKDLKKHIRNSYEYRSMVQFMREHMGMDHCAILPNMSNADHSKIKIEIHHSPIDLETICRVVFRKRAHMGECIYIPATAYEVLWCHYSLLVGLIPLCETVHELVHNGNIFIPPNKPYGYYNLFVQRYYDYFELEELELLDKISERAKTFIQDYSGLLNINYVEVNMGEAMARCAAMQQVKQIATESMSSKNGLKAITASKPKVRLFKDREELRSEFPEFEAYWETKWMEVRNQ